MIGESFIAEGLKSAVQNGSPGALTVVGRLFGLGQAEQRALVTDGVPGWFWAVAGVAGGFYAGTWAHKRHAGALPKFLR